MLNTLLPYIMIGSLITVYVLSYWLNKRTPVPKAALDKIDPEACNACNNFTCAHRGDE
jgi:hypothetical protein